MDLVDRNLDILDEYFVIGLSVDDLRRIMKLFSFVEYQMGIDGEAYLDYYDRDLKRRLERKYRMLLKEGDVDCL